MPSTKDVSLARVALGRRLAELRRQAGLSQRSLAPETGFSRSVLARAEKGHRHVSQDFWLIVDTTLGAQGELVGAHDQILAMERSLREESRRLELAERERRIRRLRRGRGRPAPAVQSVTDATATVTEATPGPNPLQCPYCHRPVAITIQVATPEPIDPDYPSSPLRRRDAEDDSRFG
jgi:transcriptional regulator with XRE-family HTH domain